MNKRLASLAMAVLLSVGTRSAFSADIVATVAMNPSFKIFTTALETAGFSETLKSSGSYTVFAPTDEAFAKLPPRTWEQIAENKVKLAGVLAYHVVPGKISMSQLKAGKMKTVHGTELRLTVNDQEIRVNDANITQSDLAADNGIIHAIDSVILPPN